jgi:hypothetical protein
MKLKIEKKHNTVFVEIATDDSKKPIRLELSQSQVAGVIDLLNMANKAQAMKFEMEL